MLNIGLIDQITSWWEGLSAARQVFYGIGIVAGLVSLVLAVLSLTGLEGHDALGAADAIDTGGEGVFSLKTIVGFFLGFGWAGGLAIDAGLTLLAALAVAVFAGGIFVAGIVVMIRMIRSMRSDGTMQIGRAVGAVGTVYVTVPAQRASGGQVTVNFSGRQETFHALSAGSGPIPSGEKVKVTAVVDGRTVLVEPL